MKRVVLSMFAVALAAQVSTSSLQAQVSLGVGGGVTIPTGDLADAVKTGWHGLANVGYTLPSGLGFRGDLFYGQNSIEDNPLVSGSFKLAGGFGNVTYNFPGQGVRPYVIGTIGMLNTKFEDLDGETDLVFGGGAGVMFKAGSDSNIFAEARYLIINSDPDSQKLIPITLGIRFGI